MAATVAHDPEPLIAAVVAAGDAALPGRIVAWYVTGSHADGSAVPGSDLDILAVLDGAVRTGEDQVIRRSRHGLGEPYRIFVDLNTIGLDALIANSHVTLVKRSRLVAGGDIRARLPQPDLSSLRRRVMHVPTVLSARLRGTDVLQCPLAAPDPGMPFLGYEVCRFLPPGHHDRDTLKDMVALATFMATALVQQRTTALIASKADAVAAYRRLAIGPWGDLLVFLLETVRGRWHWRVPETPSDREALERASRDLLAFEREYYEAYAEFLTRELESDDPARVVAAREALLRINFERGGS